MEVITMHPGVPVRGVAWSADGLLRMVTPQAVLVWDPALRGVPATALELPGVRSLAMHPNDPQRAALSLLDWVELVDLSTRTQARLGPDLWS